MPCQRGLEFYDSYMGCVQYIWAQYKIEMQHCGCMVKGRVSKSWLNHNTLPTLALPDIQHNKSLETAHRNTLGCSAVINTIFFTHKKSRRRATERIKRIENKATLFSLTIVSFSLLAIGAGDTQNAVDGVGSYRIVGGAGHWWRGCVGNWWRDLS